MFPGPGVASGGHQNLDSPLNNFDIAGIPTNGDFSSPLWGCFENLAPSCILSFFFPCIMFGQVVTRAQIPLCIDVKNSIRFLRNQSGYGFFIDIYFWTGAVSVLLLLALLTQSEGIRRATSNAVFVVLWGFDVLLLWLFLYFNAHIRMAVREKYELNTNCMRSRGFIEWLIDSVVANVCLPCSLAQLARHVFQYDRWEPKISLLQGDPSVLPPLEAVVHRPVRADQAGLSIMSNRRDQREDITRNDPGNIHQAQFHHSGDEYPVASTSIIGRNGDIEAGTYAPTLTGSTGHPVPIAKPVQY